MSIRVGAIIAAAGDGRRFSKKGEKRKKQFILLGGKPLFLHSANCFFYSPIITKLIVVAPENNIEYCTDLLNGEFGANNIDVIAIKISLILVILEIYIFQSHHDKLYIN